MTLATTPFTISPVSAWEVFIRPVAGREGWFEANRKAAPELPISHRELVGLIVLAHAMGPGAVVGFDPQQSEPNDGFVQLADRRICAEHKIVSVRDRREALDAIVGTYAKYARNGPAYGRGRTLLIHPNKEASHGGSVRISELRTEIGESCPFDRTFTVHVIRQESRRVLFHLIQHFPWPPELGTSGGGGITDVTIDTATGIANVAHRGIVL